MELQSLTPNLMVKDVDETVEYYKNMFGFEVEKSVGDKGALTWAMVRSGSAILMFQEANSLIEEIPQLKNRANSCSSTLFIKMTGVSELYEKVKNKAMLISPLKETFYGSMEFTVEDLNGFIISFAEFSE